MPGCTTTAEENRLAIKDKKQVIYVFFTVAMVETQLLLSVSRVIGAIQINVMSDNYNSRLMTIKIDVDQTLVT